MNSLACSDELAIGFRRLLLFVQGPRLRLTLDDRVHLEEVLVRGGIRRRCGIKSFYVPRSNPDGFSVNVRCLDRSTIDSVTVEAFDGQNWEQSAAALRHLGRMP